MRLKGQQLVDDLEKKYLALKAICPEQLNAIYRDAESDNGDPTVVHLICDTKVSKLENELSEAEKNWLLERTECRKREAKTFSLPLPPDPDSDAWQKKGDSLVLTDNGDSRIKNALLKEKRERAANWRSVVAVIVSIAALIVSFVSLAQKDTKPSIQTDNKAAPAGQPSPGTAKH